MTEEKKQKTKKPKLRLRLAFLYIGSFVASVAPIASCLAVRWDIYTTTPAATLKLCGGGLIAALFIILKLVGALHAPRRIVLYGTVFVMAYLLEAILNDLILLSGLALLGELLDLIFFQHAIKSTREKILISKTADATAVQVEDVLKRYVGRV